MADRTDSPKKPTQNPSQVPNAPVQAFSLLRESAKRSLAANIVETTRGCFLRAGSHQFASFWTRDFAWAARGVLAIDRADVVRDHVSILLSQIDSSGLVPRIFDDVASAKRVVAHTVFRWLPDGVKSWIAPVSYSRLLRAEHRGEHGTIAIDSNALVIIAARDLHANEPDADWLHAQTPALLKALGFLFSLTSHGTRLVSQSKFEDWQDSCAREGSTLYVNLLFARAFAAARDLGLDSGSYDESTFLDLISRTFRNSDGVFKSVVGLDVVSLDGNLMILNEPSLAELNRDGSLYARLKSHAIWSRAAIPGVCTVEDYPASEISFFTRAVGLRYYHDRLLWSWLSGLAAKAALRSGDREEASRIFASLEKLAERDGWVGEVYSPHDLSLVRTWSYRSEAPFSWGAGCVLEALAMW